jgi:signal transduction histidine kinase
MGDYKAAQSTAKEAMQLAEKLGIPMFLADCHLNLSRAQRNLGLYAEAIQNAQAGFAIVEKDKRAGSLDSFEEELFEIHKAMGRADLALPFLESAMERLKNKIGNDTKQAIADAETKYQTAEKEKEILELAIANDRISKQRNLVMGGGIILGLLGFFGYRLNKVNKDRNDKKAFAEALIFAQEEERKRIGRDLHDGIGQSLLLIKKQMDNTAGVTLENQQMITATLEEVRSISQDLHPFQLDKFGLTATISDMVLKIEQSTDLFITREIDDIDNMLDPKSEIHLYRTIQEALSNIVKHAGATAAKISVNNRPDNIQVSILDNGKGFDLELAVVTSKSLGIRTMHERISAIGGKLKIEKGEASGTQVNITVSKSKNAV